jgi:hypothetical protein
MTILTEQLDLFTDGAPAPVIPHGPSGHDYVTRGRGWRTRWLGHRFGWTFYRAIGSGWEPWEPDLPYGVAHVTDRDTALDIVAGWAATFGDDPWWLNRRNRR